MSRDVALDEPLFLLHLANTQMNVLRKIPPLCSFAKQSEGNLKCCEEMSVKKRVGGGKLATESLRSCCREKVEQSA